MSKKNIINIISSILLIILFIISIYNINNKLTATDAIKFKMEYESINNKTREKDGKKIRKLNISTDNPFIYKSEDELIEMINNKETFIVYFGFNDCPWCRSIVPSLINAAKDLNLDKIYYVDVKNIRDTLELDENNNVITSKKSSKSYYKLVNLLDNVLDDYILTSESGEEINTGKKRIYAPNIVSIKNGKALEMKTGISEDQTDPYMKLTKKMKNDSYNAFKCSIKCITENKNICSNKTAC